MRGPPVDSVAVAFSVRSLPRFAVMGILNVTPDSFSDGGRHASVDLACAHGRALAAADAAIVDVGGESTRPGAEPVAAPVERDRVVPVISEIADEFSRARVAISVDTTKATVASDALDAGAVIVNDVSGATHDPNMLSVIADHDAGVVLMHMQGEPRTMQHDPRYGDVVVEVGDYLAERVDAALAAGVRSDAILVDPGIGFGKTLVHNLTLLARVTELAERVGAPLLIGTSRKGFLGAVTGEIRGAAVDMSARDDATVATSVYAFAQGARAVRVHDVTSSVRAARLLDVITRNNEQGVLT